MDERVYRMTEEILLELDKMKPEEINSLREEWLGELENRSEKLCKCCMRYCNRQSK